MASPELLRKWERIEALLNSALAVHAQQVEPRLGTTGELIVEAKHFLSHNELGLAFEAVAEAGRMTQPHASFWNYLAQAAAEMEMDVSEYHERSLGK